jgi:hypothetical protein
MTIVTLFVNLLMIAFIASLVWRKLATSDSLVYWSAAVVRLAAGVCVGLLYKYYYDDGGDTFRLFNSAIELTASGYEPVLTESRSLFFVYIISIVNAITSNNYWVTSLWFSLFSFLCSYRLVSKLDEIFPSFRIASRVSLLFIPSVVFWTSGIMKESIAFSALAVLVVPFLSLMQGKRLKLLDWLSAAFFLLLLLNLKYYWAAVLIPCMISALVVRWAVERRFDNKWIIIGSWLLTFLLLCIGVSFTHPNFRFENFLFVIVDNYNSYPEHDIVYYNLSADWTSIFVNSPWALYSGLFRPMIFEPLSSTGYLAAFENLLLLVLVVWKLRSVRMPIFANRIVVLTAIVYVVVLCVFLALSTPNLGTLSRYRVGFLSFFVLLILADHPVFKLINGKSSNHIRS